MRWVRPIFATSRKDSAFAPSASRRRATAGMTSRRKASTVATWIAVGKASFVDWPRFTSSLGWTRRLSPRSPPRISLARLARTSLTFMFVWVPLPVCHTTSGNSPSHRPASTSSAAATMAASPGGLEDAELDVDEGDRLLHADEGVHEGERHPLAGDPEVLERALGLRSPQPVGRHRDRAEGVALGAGANGGCDPCAPPPSW